MFAKRIRELRMQNNKTLDEVANETGISKTALSYYENDKREAGISVLIILAKYYKESTDYLLGIEDMDGHRESETFEFSYKDKFAEYKHKRK